jgi:hypothetical protein
MRTSRFRTEHAVAVRSAIKSMLETGWYTANLTTNNVRAKHLLPRGEEHRAVDCKCGPRIEHDAEGMLLLHRSFDGREAVAWAKAVLNGTYMPGGVA